MLNQVPIDLLTPGDYNGKPIFDDTLLLPSLEKGISRSHIEGLQCQGPVETADR